MRIRLITLAMLHVALILMLPLSAIAIDLTGTWVGTQVCQYFSGTAANPRFPDDVLTISQKGADLFFVTPLVNGVVFRAQVIDDARSPSTKAQAVFIACGTTDTSEYQELGRAKKLETSSNPSTVTASFEATSSFFQNDPDGSQFLGTCQWTYRRSSTADPRISGCPDTAPSASLTLHPVGRPHP